MGLTKATLQKLSSVEKGKLIGKPMPVQFNPTSLRLSIANKTESGQALEVRTRQYLATGSSKLTMQLVFDTADEGTTGQPVSVQTRTKLVTQFLLPEAQGKKHAPPAVRFQWGEFLFDGIVDSATEDIDLFADTGTPLRAKVDITITGQSASDLKLQTGPGASRDAGAKAPGALPPALPGARGAPSAQPQRSGGGGPAGPGGAAGAGGSGANRTETANAGESAAAFAARQGLDPAAWRSFADQIDDPLSLPAGLSINFTEGASLAPGLASANAFRAGIAESVASAIEVARTPAASADAIQTDEARRAGFTLSDAGGVGRAVQIVQSDRAQAAVASSVQSFATPTSNAERTPGVASAPVGDRRQNGYGFGVPLRARIAPAAALRAAVVFGARSITSRPQSSEPPTTDDPTMSPWVQLPQLRENARPRHDRTATGRRCRCSGRCGCG